jgi:hypothetical protein
MKNLPSTVVTAVLSAISSPTVTAVPSLLLVAFASAGVLGVVALDLFLSESDVLNWNRAGKSRGQEGKGKESDFEELHVEKDCFEVNKIEG